MLTALHMPLVPLMDNVEVESSTHPVTSFLGSLQRLLFQARVKSGALVLLADPVAPECQVSLTVDLLFFVEGDGVKV